MCGTGQALTAASLARLLHYANILPISGESYRLKRQRQARRMKEGMSQKLAEFRLACLCAARSNVLLRARLIFRKIAVSVVFDVG